jgi:hypothetical protein
MMSLSTPCRSLADHAKTSLFFVQELYKLFLFFGIEVSPNCDCSVGHVI